MADFLALVTMQAFTFGIAGLGAVIAFRVIRFPDLTADGSFMLGSALYGAVLGATGHWTLAAAAAVCGGALAGGLTAMLNASLGVSRLLAGILTTMVCYSLSFRLLGGQPNVALVADKTMFATPEGSDPTIFALLVATLFMGATGLLVWQLLRSQLGMILRVNGANPALLVDIGRRTSRYTAVGLAIANGLIALSATLVSSQQGFVDINLGGGIVVAILAALVLGEQLVDRVPALRSRIVARVVSPLTGTVLYFSLFLFALRASIQGWLPIGLQPTDLKLVSAALVIAVVACRRRFGDAREQALPL